MENGSNASAVYSKAEQYWQTIPPDVNGMLGGFSHLSKIDIHDSRRFLLSMIKQLHIDPVRALDCGSGIGRVTKYLLLPIFKTVDMVDVIEQFINESSVYLGEELNARVEKKICSGLQNLFPETGRYDAVWVQWVSGHLTDDDFVDFLKRCRSSLTESGYLFVKENVTSNKDPDFDELDNSWTRPRRILLELFEKANLQMLDERTQKKFPPGMYEVRMYCLR